MSTNINIVKKWIENNGFKAIDCKIILVVNGDDKYKLAEFAIKLKNQFPDKEIYVNDNDTNNMFISINK